MLIALIGLLVRLPHLGARPMHTDEAVNGYIVGQLLAGRTYIYDARDRHGPAIFALALPLAGLQGAHSFSELTESELRLSSVVAGTSTILLFAAAVELFGLGPCLVAALLFALAPLPVYYDRYFIHESLFCAITFALILTGYQWCKKRTAAAAAWVGVCAALMMATKETCILHFAALCAAVVCFWLWNLRGRSLSNLRLQTTGLDALATFLLVSATLFTWFGRNWNLLPELLQAEPNFITRAAGEGHEKAVWYYAQLLAGGWSGAIILILFCIGLMLTLRKRDESPHGFLAFYALFIALFYSVIPYKTPWLTLNLWLPITLLAGLAADSLWRLPSNHPRIRIGLCAALGTILATAMAHDTRQRVFLHPADESNPYAYAHTSEDLPGLPAEIERLAHQSALAAPRIAVIAADPWPLPWYLRHFSNVGFWQPGQPAAEADFYITSTEAGSQYQDRLQGFRPEFFGARPGVLILLWSREPK